MANISSISFYYIKYKNIKITIISCKIRKLVSFKNNVFTNNNIKKYIKKKILTFFMFD